PEALVQYPGSVVKSDVNLDPNHSHFVLVEGNEWGSELPTIFGLTSALTAKVPRVVAILASGGANSRDEVVQVVRQNFPLIVIEGSGGLADEISAAWKARPNLPEDPAMAEIICDGRLEFHLLTNSVEGAERLILRELRGDNILYEAWEMFADYDLNAILQQKRFDLLQGSILIVGIAATALAVIKQLWAPPDAVVTYRSIWWWVRHLIILLPILLTVLITAANRFKHGNRWMMLRAGAEAIKREIYRYRTRTTYYGGWAPDQPSPEQQLSRKVQDITQATMETDANLAILESYDKKKGFPPYINPSAEGADDGFKKLTPDRYIEVRLEDQLNYFNRVALKLGRRMTALQWAVWLIGAVGTYLALVGQQIWVAVTTSVAAALTSYLGYKLSEDKLMKFNQARTELANVRAWWNALSPDDQADQANVNTLVEHTEQVLKSELDNWVQLKQNVMEEVRKVTPIVQPAKEQPQ
ncbi:MAG TPA: DUF4231 domain-containing protein, partial [Pyrinomonadaceae bacterium]|nr:DUF4231 domain-containing protein [Pyrinomonadaceae bacterium]